MRPSERHLGFTPEPEPLDGFYYLGLHPDLLHTNTLRHYFHTISHTLWKTTKTVNTQRQTEHELGALRLVIKRGLPLLHYSQVRHACITHSPHFNKKRDQEGLQGRWHQGQTNKRANTHCHPRGSQIDEEYGGCHPSKTLKHSPSLRAHAPRAKKQRTTMNKHEINKGNTSKTKQDKPTSPDKQIKQARN